MIAADFEGLPLNNGRTPQMVPGAKIAYAYMKVLRDVSEGVTPLNPVSIEAVP